MKKTFNINLGGTPFTIDEDAYQLLTQYFDTLSHVYKDATDSNEFMTDIEARVAELMLMRMKSPQTIITLPVAEEVIAQIGHPQDFEEVEITPESVKVEERIVPPPIPPQPEKVTKRLFRNPDNKLLGGVCSGIAAYLNIDTTWVRLATVALCFLSVSTAALVYFILWIVVPEAVTPLQQMQMRGETPTFQNIGKNVTGMFGNGAGTQQNFHSSQQASGFGYTLSRICAVAAKVILIMIGIICVPVVLALIVTSIALIVALIASVFGLSTLFIPDVIPTNDFNILLLTCIGVTITVGIPLAMLIWLIVTGSRRNLSHGWKRTLIITWIIGFVLTVAGSFLCRVYNIKDKYSSAIERLQTRSEQVEVIADSINDDSDETTENIITRDSISITKSNGKKIVINDEGVKISKETKKPVKIKK